MQKTLTLLTVFLCVTVMHAQGIQYPKDPNLKTFIQDTHALPNQNLQAELRDGEAWDNFRQSHCNWWVEFNEQTSTPHRAFGTPIAGSGSSAEEKAYNFFTNELRAFGSNQVDIDIRSNNTSKYHYITYVQEFNGIEVLWSEATFRVSLDGNIIMFGLDIYPDINLSTTPTLTAEAAQAFASTGIIGTVTSADGNELKILPVSGEGKLEYKLVYEINLHIMQVDGIPGNYYTLVDANSGAVYYRQNQVHACGAPASALGANIQINSDIKDNPLVGLINRGMPYIRIEIDGDFYFADANGLLSLNTISDPTPAINDLQGRYAKISQGNPDVFMGDETFHIDSAAVTIIPGDNTIEFDAESGALASEVSAYYWQNIVHDFMKSYWPAFTDLDFPQLVRVERTDGSCNAFYDGSSTNFYAAGGGCPSTALFNDVVMHEYGHGINYDLYNWLGDPGGGMNNGALQEGYADMWAISVTDNPILGQGFLGGADTYVRRYDDVPKVFPQDLVGEVHADGEIIAGAWWDVEENFGSHSEMTDLFNETFYATADGAAGSEGTIYTDVLIDALVADDDNADLTDGTPRIDEISSAFCEHGISLIGQVSSDHEGIFSYVTPEEPIEVETDIDVDYPTYIGDMQMYYKINNEPAWSAVEMVNVGGTTYKADIPAQPEGTVIGYYFEVADLGGCGNAVFPAEANTDDPNLPFYALVGYVLQHTEDFDNEFGSWVVDPFGDDDATTGEWDINEPIGSTDDVGYQVQTDDDHTTGSGNLCAFTGNAALFDGVGTNDVDHGKTTLRSEIFDLTVYEDPVAVYWRKYSNDSPTSANPGNDVWQVYISDDNDNWVKVERTYTADNTWRRNAIRIKDYVDVTETVSFIFIAQDSVLNADPDPLVAGGSLVEAAIDDLEIWDTKEPDTTGNNIHDSELIAGVFPNPASEFVNVYFSADVTGEVEITLYNNVGEIISTNHINATAGSSFTLRTADLPEGIYMISCKTDKGNANKRVMIQHQ